MNVRVENEEEDIEAIMNLKSTSARSSIYATVSIIELPNSLPDVKGGVPTPLLIFLGSFIEPQQLWPEIRREMPITVSSGNMMVCWPDNLSNTNIR